MAYIERNCHRSITRKRVAEAVGIHPHHLTRLLSTHAGRSYTAIITDCRLRRAEDLLRTSTQDLAGIAYACGLSSANYFIQLFKKHYGCTPGAWRETHAAG